MTTYPQAHTIPEDIRASMQQALPAWMQAALTARTGKPYAGEVLRQRTPLFPVLTATASLAAGVGLSLGAHLLGYDALAPLGWVPTIAGARKLQLNIVHQAAHDNLFGHKRLDRWLGYLLSILLTIQNFPAYKRMHIAMHHSKRLLTDGEATADFLTDMLGLQLGAPTAVLRRQLRRALVSPRLHLRFLGQRLRGQVEGAPWGYAVVACGVLLALVASLTLTQTWGPFLLVWGIPLTIGYQIAAALRLCVEHLWPAPGAKADRAGVARLTQAVLLGDPVPEPTLPLGRKLWAWTRWVVRLLGVHLPLRYMVLPGDSGPAHDFHHRHIKSPAWAWAIFARQQDSAAGHPGWPAYTEVWGFSTVLEAVLASISQAKQEA